MWPGRWTQSPALCPKLPSLALASACCHLPPLAIEGSGDTLGREGKEAPVCFRPEWPCKVAPHLVKKLGVGVTSCRAPC